LLGRTELTGVRGPHYWKDRDIVWAGPRHVEKSGDFLRKDSNAVAFKVPDRAQMAEWVRRGPSVALLDRLLGRNLRGPFARFAGKSFDRQGRAREQRRE